MSISWGMGEHWGGYLSWGFGFAKKVIKKVKEAFGRFIHRPEKFTFTIEIRGTVVRPFKKTFNIVGKRGIMHIINWLLNEDEELD